MRQRVSNRFCRRHPEAAIAVRLVWAPVARCQMQDVAFPHALFGIFWQCFHLFCLACCLTGIAPWHSGFAHWLWKCLRLGPDVLHSQELWAQILDPVHAFTVLCSTVMSTTGNWHSFFMSHLTHLHLKRNIVQLTVYFHYCAVDWIVLQIFFKPFVTEVTMPCSCFLPYPSICWQACHVWCLFLWPLRLLWLTSWCMWLLWVFHQTILSGMRLVTSPLSVVDVSCQMWISKELSKDWDCISCGLSFLWSSNLCLTCLGNGWVVF